MLTTAEKLLFLFLTASSLAYAYVGFSAMARVIKRGQGRWPSTGELLARAQEALTMWAATLPIWKARPVASIFHGMIAWGFMFYFLVNLGDVVEGFFPITFLGEGLVGDLYRLLADLFTASVLVGMVYFLLRRFVLRSAELSYHPNVMLVEAVRNGGIRRDSLIVGLFILFHVGFRLLGQSFAVAAEGGDWFQPFATLVSQLWRDWGEAAWMVGRHIGWWGALGLVLLFIPYFPYTKHLHLILSGVNFLTKPRRAALGALEPVNFDDETVEEFGVARIEELPWTHLIDAYACIMCNRCQDVCPAYVTGKELSPSTLEINKRYFLNANLEELAAGKQSDLRLLDFAISESAVWACTTCGACVEVCPVGNEPMFDILHIRRRQMLMENAFPDQLKNAYRGMERNGNPWNQRAGDRLAWAQELAVSTVEENPQPDILWWVGCAPAYDPRAQQTARAFAQVLQAAKVNFAVLGEMESCTGDAARRTGNEYLFYELAKANIETLNQVQPKRIVTTCPHCLHTLGKEYRDLGGQYEVIHHSQLLSELAAAKQISVQANGDSDLITFHDPCYLGRHNGIVDAPRAVMQGLGLSTVEMPRHGRGSFCCGAGGGQMWKEEEHGTQAVNKERYAEATATGARTVAVACPFCLTMLTDAGKQAGDGVQIKDLAELAAERLNGA
jgi:Fe-S oxidoreductase